MKILTAVRRFFYLTPRDLGMQTMTAKEIAEAMKYNPNDPIEEPSPFAIWLGELLDDSKEETTATI